MSSIYALLRIIAAVAICCLARGSGGNDIGVYELRRGDFSIKVTNFGARIMSVVLPDRNGKATDVVLGYDSAKDYLNDQTYFGAILGRVASRISGAQFTLNGIHYKLSANEGNNTLHGGKKGFSLVPWKVIDHVKDGPNPFIVLSYYSHDGEEGFPGNLLATVTYSLLDSYKFEIIMAAEVFDKPTPVNLANHNYWNLGGQNSGNVLSDQVQIIGSRFIQFDAQVLPTGKIFPVRGTPLDFQKPHTVGSRIAAAHPNGYDAYYVLDKEEADDQGIALAAAVHSNKTGLGMRLWTNAPALGFYTANFLSNVTGIGGYVYQPRASYTFETAGFPDAVNHPEFPSTILYPGHLYSHYMMHEFFHEA